MAPPTTSAVNDRVAKLEKDVEAQRKEDLISSMTIEKEDVINKDIKAYENNLKVVGLTHDIKESQKKDPISKREWRQSILRRVLVETGIVEEDKIFEKTAAGKPMIRGIIRNLHPLRQKNNSAIVIAFTETWFVEEIKEKVRNDCAKSRKK